jgi:alkylation response protein AidB-like acyl-CoA dehydrogenase
VGADEDIDLDLLRQSAREFLAERAERDSVKDLAAMDWTGLLVDEELGGAGWRPVEASLIAEELGRAQDGSMWFGSVMAGAALASAPEDVRQKWLPALLDGTATAGCAAADDVVRVVRGDEADVLVTFGRNGIHVIERLGAQKCRLDGDLLDVTRPVWRVDITNGPSVLIGSSERAERLLAMARLLLSADSVGAVSMTVARLTAYLRDRIAFGAPIASFQAVQHRLVELLVFEVKARAVVMKAARAAVAGDVQRAVALSTVAHAFVAAKATGAVDECMQLSGGIGFTWEYPLHHELRRVFTNAHVLGNARSSRAFLAEVLGW